MKLTANAPAKINLILKVLGVRPDKYHELFMLMQKLDLHDTITIETRSDDKVTMTCSDASLECDERNLCVKSVRALQRATGATTGVAIHLDKRTPTAAGMGGGSSDGATTLALYNKLAGLDLSRDELSKIGVKLGADVPFFIWEEGAAMCEGIGEVITPVIGLPKMWLILINPGFGVSTKWVYENADLLLTAKPSDDSTNALVKLLKNKELSTIEKLIAVVDNDLEKVTRTAHAQIEEMERFLTDGGALRSWMTGSGPTVVGIFNNELERDKALERAVRKGWRVISASSL